MLKSDSIVKLAPALLKAQKEMGVAIKDSKNSFFKSKYADLNSIIDASQNTLNNNGIMVIQPPNILEHTGKSVIETILLHESGEYISSYTEVVCAKQNDPQALGSAISYARRYGLQSLVLLKAEDDDGNLGSGKVVTSQAVVKSVEEKVAVVKEVAVKSQEATKTEVVNVSVDSSVPASPPFVRSKRKSGTTDGI